MDETGPRTQSYRFPEGGLDDRDKHVERCRSLESKLDAQLARVAVAVDFTDVRFCEVTDAQRAEGLTRMEFEDYPGVFVGPDMAQHMIEAELRHRMAA